MNQKTMIKGKIVDNAGEPMIGVNVLVKERLMVPLLILKVIILLLM